MSKLRSFAVLTLVATLVGCAGDEPAAPPASPDEDVHIAEPDVMTLPDTVDVEPFTPTGSCDDGTVRILRVTPWVGRGMQVTLELATPEGAPATEGADVPMRLVAGEDEWPATASAAWQSRGITGVVLVPSAEAAENDDRKAAAKALIEGLPATEEVALWRLGEVPELSAELTQGREHVLERLAAIAPSAGGAITEEALEPVRDALQHVGNPYSLVSRSLVVVAGDGPPSELQAKGPDQPVATLWLLASQQDPDPIRGVYGWSGRSPKEGGGALAEQIVARRYGIVRVGACVDVPEDTELTLFVGETPCTVKAPKPFDHMELVTCDAAAAAADDYPYGDTVDLVLTPEELALWEQYHAAESKEDFTLRMRIGVGEPIQAKAHFRGHTSLSCERKNYNVNLDGGRKRRLMPGAASDELYLISMCKDEGYFNQTFANRLLQPLGIFPLDFRYVKVTLNGKSQGVYMMLEDPTETLLDDHLALASIIRRRFDPEDKPEDIKWPDGDGAEAALLRYKEVMAIATEAPEDEVLPRLREAMDIDGYLLWMAFNTFMVNGDYVDEAYFYGAAEAGGPVWFQQMGWDPDDLFSACHHASKFALVDPHGILYCAEGDLDQAILRSKAVYDRYVELLEGLMTTLTADKLEAKMAEIRAELFAVLDDDMAAAMVVLAESHPEAATAAGAKKVIRELMDEMLADAEASRAALLAKIATYKEASK